MKIVRLTVLRTIILCLSFGNVTGAEPRPEPGMTNAEAMKKLRGRWEIVSVENDGVPLDPKEDASHVVIEKKSLVITGASRREPYTFILDTGAKIPQLDMTFDSPGDRPHLGIFKFEADKLIIVCGEPGKARPTKFDVKVGTKFVLRRAKAGK